METRYRVTFHMMDTERNCDRKIGENNMLFTGDKIEAFTDEAIMKFYMAELKYCFWLRQEPKNCYLPFVRFPGSNLSRALNLHLSSSKSIQKTFRAFREHSEHTIISPP